jgi:integrase/recombinase XerD
MTLTCGSNSRKPVASFSAFLTPSCHQRPEENVGASWGKCPQMVAAEAAQCATGCLKQNRPSVSGEATMRPRADVGMSLYGPTGARKYLSAAERRRFIKAANRAEPETRLFCLVLGWSGGRISEVLALTPAAIDIDIGVANILTLKRRKRGIVRQVPLPRDVLSQLNRFFKLRCVQRDPELAVQQIWGWSRTIAWRRVKEVMAAAAAAAAAGISGPPAMPRRPPAFIRSQCLSIQCAAALGTALAGSRLVAHHINLW